jgi:predicted nuclease of predicted toxin-antitoxin system
VRFLIDAQLPPALARMLSARGHLAEHVTDIGPADASDADLWQYAFEHEAVLVTKDEDFATTVVLGGDVPAVVWVRVGNTRRQALLDWFEPMVDRIVEMVEAGNEFIELR